MMKLEDMVMRGEWDELLGSEIVLCRGRSLCLTRFLDRWGTVAAVTYSVRRRGDRRE